MRGAFFVAMLIAATAGGIALAVSQLDGLTIDNTGSTNTGAWRIALRSDGSGVAYTNLPRVVPRLQGAAYVVPIGSTPGRNFSVQPNVAVQYFHDVYQVRTAGTAGSTCAKSASFGSYTRVHWHGWVSPDLECPQADAGLAKLAQETRALEEYAGIIASHKVPLPREPRRPPQ